jgi:S-adenosylmethionine:tRNA ribosyltransferase-isomerase
MLVLHRDGQQLTHGSFKDVVNYLNAGDTLVLNDTKVMPARLFGHRLNAHGEPLTGKVEVLLLQPNAHYPAPHVWDVLAKPARKLPVGSRVQVGDAERGLATATVLHQGERGRLTLQWELGDSFSSVVALMEALGQLPLPPYFGRQATLADADRYQTVVADANKQASQAAPTAGLHFTPEVLAQLEAKGVTVAKVTLHVGTGTFLPVMVEDVTQHTLHTEWYDLPQATAQTLLQTKQRGGKVVAVGTTVVRTLESAVLQHPTSWQQGCQGDTNLFIRPGFSFKLVQGLLTNFHLPGSTLLMLVSAFAQSRPWVLHAYQEAARYRYRFYSYGDCMLVF